MALAYLFECHFEDGTILFQTPTDVSSIDSSKSAFYDVSLRLAEVEVFGLVNNEHTYAVFLKDGHFEIDGVPFELTSGDDCIPVGTAFRLVYFRRHRHQFGGVEDHLVTYHFGWQATINGKNLQRTISLR
jgi:hypothetical protein